MDKFDILKRAKEISRRRLTSAPDFTIFQSIDAQIDYMQQILDGEVVDRSKLRKINVGLYAIREFEESDHEFAEVLKKFNTLQIEWLKG